MKTRRQLPLFSVLMPVHGAVTAQCLHEAIASVVDQSHRPAEIVLIRDGALPTGLEGILGEWEGCCGDLFRIVPLERKSGSAPALQAGLASCSSNWVARMDCDDLSVPDRFRKQLTFLADNPRIDVLGGWMAEFASDPQRITAVRKVPGTHAEVLREAPLRCPVNHPTVVYRKRAVLACGGYEQRFEELADYHLWAKMIRQGYRFHNLPEVLVKGRAADGLYRRRGGWPYAKAELLLEKEFLRMGLTNLPAFALNVLLRLSVRLMPGKARALVYRCLLRHPGFGHNPL
jgi:glycosyltransferase involved in cell wall biosynthesis